MRVALYPDEEPHVTVHEGSGHQVLTVPSWDVEGLAALIYSEAFNDLSEEEQEATRQEWLRMMILGAMMTK